MRTKTTREVLVEARALLAKRGGWTQGVLARDRDGDEVANMSANAVRFCAVGAIRRVCGASMGGAVDMLSRCIPFAEEVSTYNDAPSTRKKDILNLYDCAIEKAGTR